MQHFTNFYYGAASLRSFGLSGEVGYIENLVNHSFLVLELTDLISQPAMWAACNT